MNDEEEYEEGIIKVHFPGESLWAKKVGTTPDGRIIAELRNQSIHGIDWGTRVTLAIDGYEIAEPSELVELARRNVAQARKLEEA